MSYIMGLPKPPRRNRVFCHGTLSSSELVAMGFLQDPHKHRHTMLEGAISQRRSVSEDICRCLSHLYTEERRNKLAGQSAVVRKRSRIRHDMASMASSHCSVKIGGRWRQRRKGGAKRVVAPGQAADSLVCSPLMMCRRKGFRPCPYRLDRALC